MIVKIFNGNIFEIKDQNIDNIFQLKYEISKILKRRKNDINILLNGNLLNDTFNTNNIKCNYYDIILTDSFHGNKVTFITI